MLKIKPEFWTRNGKEKFVVLSMDDFEKVHEMIEDEGLARIMREAKRKEASAPTISHEEMLRRLGMKPPRQRKARRSR
jgi:PHD/YefM family antitoxin component YafN of YafNO toxin-antitoxin module